MDTIDREVHELGLVGIQESNKSSNLEEAINQVMNE
jgi:hypothetical protein